MFLLVLALLGVPWVQSHCYEPSVAHPPPEYDPGDALLKRAFASINATLTMTVAAPEFAHTSFSVEITSSKESLWSRHQTARERNASRPDINFVTGDALYRIASISKSFTVLGLLYQHAAGNLSLDNTVDTYVEELREKQSGSVPWKDITLRTLASQLSGIPRDFGQGDLINPGITGDPSFHPVEAGLPPISREGLPTCDEYADYEPPCYLDDLIKSITRKAPVFAPNQKSTYSNVAFDLLGVVLANVTGQSYESYINDAIFIPLNMSKSTFSTPDDSAGVIPFEPHYWGVDEGIQNPTGGIYSSTTDLSKFLRNVLTRHNGITHALNWLHPVSWAEGLNSFYGLPWEIFQTDRILLKSKRPVRFITKGGGLPGYGSIIMTVPEYNLGITILVAGNLNLLEKLKEIVTVEMVRAAEELAIQQMQARYAGTYSAKAGLNSSVTIVADHRGLVLTNFISNGTDFFDSTLWRLFTGGANVYAQLTPTLLYQDEEKHNGELWRLVPVVERSGETKNIWDEFCITNVDAVRYGDLPVNEVVFWGKEGGKADIAELTGFRVKLERADIDKTLWGNEAQDALEV
ncbi:beta-lactamase/transpeptidase-like protein [Amniculicola lignicola CBS 123094]|uniref:Beta-lactamase/transpeptidase-like protein n=1 Tax=Amniculicola lignicola CBS 123094 TaxID=1392246 RepID=A0A6A5WQL7_9PLEO|nr:beta-lactamase/transpeptidase-like protein [Amniculicola lignicola CBS 123094]